MRHRVRIRQAAGLVALILIAFRMKSLIVSASTIYVPVGELHNHRLIRHQLKHIEQMRRQGRLVFTLNYIWYALRHGHKSNPYEVEARQAENDTRIQIRIMY